MTLIRMIAQVRRHPWHGYAVATLIFVVAFLLRQAFGQQDDPNVPFLTFFPAILLATLFSGVRAGIVIAILSGLAAMYFFIPPYGTITLGWPWGYFVMALFSVVSAVMIATAYYLNKAMDDLARERDNSAVLFRELQHRVANNMQFVSALLTLQSKKLGADPSAQVFNEARSRFDAMARVHRHLYDPESLNKPMGEYLEKLCREMIDASGAKNIVCVVQIPENIRLDVQRLLTMSLVITEILTNSLKHAFKDREQGTVSINLERQNGRLALTVADDGLGFAAEAFATRDKGLGMRVLEGFARQLGGDFSIDGSKGTTARLVFPG
jgi:two-component sensor histidine kinase